MSGDANAPGAAVPGNTVPGGTVPGNTVPMTVEVPVIDRATDPVHALPIAGDPAALAASWLPADDEPRMLMTLSTVDGDGFPRSRTVMLSEFDGERFFFHTDADSRKVADLAADPKVSLTILWPGFTRQIVVQGLAERAPADEEARAYAARSPYLRQLAWQNTQEVAELSLAERERVWEAFAVEHPEPSQPAGWAGFAVRPHRYLFWVSHPAAPSRRLEYTRSAPGSPWAVHPLPG